MPKRHDHYMTKTRQARPKSARQPQRETPHVRALESTPMPVPSPMHLLMHARLRPCALPHLWAIHPAPLSCCMLTQPSAPPTAHPPAAYLAYALMPACSSTACLSCAPTLARAQRCLRIHCQNQTPSVPCTPLWSPHGPISSAHVPWPLVVSHCLSPTI